MSSATTVRLPADPAATERLGEWLGAALARGDTVAVTGELGAGKTTLVRGLARGLGVHDPDAVCSPTYLVVVEHPGRTRLLHADAYLPGKLAAFLDDGGLEYLFDRDAVVVIEWAQRVAGYLPERTLWVDLTVAPDGGRDVVLRPVPEGGFPFVAGIPKMA